MRKVIIALGILLVAGTVSAQMGSIKTAMFIVDSFLDESLYLTRGLKKDENYEKVTKEMRRRKDNTVTALRTLRWIESPGKERYGKIYRIVDTYLDAQIASINSLKESHYARRIERIVRELKDEKKVKLRALEETRKYETYRGKRLKPVPIIDKSPFESGGKTGEGGEIWFR